MKTKLLAFIYCIIFLTHTANPLSYNDIYTRIKNNNPIEEQESQDLAARNKTKLTNQQQKTLLQRAITSNNFDNLEWLFKHNILDHRIITAETIQYAQERGEKTHNVAIQIYLKENQA